MHTIFTDLRYSGTRYILSARTSAVNSRFPSHRQRESVERRVGVGYIENARGYPNV